MPTVKELREEAKSYGLRGYSTLRKPGLIQLIFEARDAVRRECIVRALKTVCCPALISTNLVHLYDGKEHPIRDVNLYKEIARQKLVNPDYTKQRNEELQQLEKR